MGSSLGLALQQLSFITQVSGLDQNKQHQKIALEKGLVQNIADPDSLQNYDLIVLAVPVDEIISILQTFSQLEDTTTIIDLGSSKKKIIQAIPSSIRHNVVAAHPMTGTEKSGPDAAISSLYQDKIVVLCNIEDSGNHQKGLAKRLFSSIGMKVIEMDMVQHDQHVAMISHMPHAISFALANSVMQQESPQDIVSLAAGGFKDMSRIAKSSPIMWTEIFKQNNHNIQQALELFQKELNLVTEYLVEEKYDELYCWMEKANQLHQILK